MSNVTGNELAEVFRENVKARRRELGITQAELARRLGIHQSSLCALENGGSRPNIDTIAAISQALDVTPSGLLSTAMLVAS